jgi:hypothetical protein
MIEVAESAMEAVQERDELIAQLRQQQLDRNEPNPEGENSTSSKVAEIISTPREVSAPQ